MPGALDNLKASMMALVVVALLIAAGTLALDSFQEGLEDSACVDSTATYNSATRTCTDGTTTNATTDAFNVTQEGLTGANNASEYLSTIGIMIGIAALISVVIGAFYFIAR